MCLDEGGIFPSVAPSKSPIGYADTFLDSYITEIYMHTPAARLAVPALVRPGAETRSYAQMSLDTCWDMMEQARQSGTSVAQVLQTRRDDPQVQGRTGEATVG